MCPSIGGWINKPWGIQAVEDYAAVKNNKGHLHAVDGSQHLIMSEVASRGSTQGPQDQLYWRRHLVERGSGGLFF